jgi:hypothetical protein
MDMTTSTPPSSSLFIIDNQLSAWHLKFGYYRIIVPTSSSVKYLALPDPAPSFPDIRGEKLNFTTVPDGDWNVAYLVPESGTQKYSLGSMKQTTLAGISKIWHPRKVDWISLNERDYDGTGSDPQLASHIFASVHTNYFGFEKVIVSYEWIPESVFCVDHETEIYALIDGRDVAPKFLAHITENSGGSDRVIGFMVEKVTGARPATIGDLPACKEVLARLHALGVAHGPLGTGDFLIVTDDDIGQGGTVRRTRALLQSFGGAYKTFDQSIFDAEIENLEPVFRQAAVEAANEERDGGGAFSLSLELSDEIRAISVRDGGLHPRVIEQAREGRITMTQDEHKRMLAEWGREEVARKAP